MKKSVLKKILKVVMAIVSAALGALGCNEVMTRRYKIRVK